MLLERICNIDGISGFEYKGAEMLAGIFSKTSDEVRVDELGNVEAYIRCGKANAPLIMLEAHFDVIGLMVSKVHEDGYISFITVGGVDPRILPGMELIIHGKKDIFGVVGIKPPHILTAKEMKRSTKTEELTIDTGEKYETLRELVKPGDAISFKKDFAYLGENKFSGSGLDDRAGIAAILEAARLVKEEKIINADVCILASTTEETGRTGAKCGARRINPDLAIIVDVTHGETPDGIKARTSPLGGGPVLCFGPNLSRKYTKQMKAALINADIPFNTEVEPDDPGTNAWVVQTVNEGVPCIMLSIPLRYMHTNIETLSLGDLKNTSAGIFEFIKNFGGDADA